MLRVLKGHLLVFGLVSSTLVFSQSDYLAIWTDYNHTNLLKGKWSLSSDYGYRVRLKYDYYWQRLHARTGIVYNTGKVKLLAGAAVFFVYLPGEVVDLELRPWQGAKYQWPQFDRFKFNHFVRLEERIYYTSTSNSSSYNSFELKFRYSLMLKCVLTKSEKWVALLGFEPFFNLYVNQKPLAVAKSRTTTGVSYTLSSKTKLRLTYVYQPKTISIFKDVGIYSNVIRLSVIQKFKK